MLVCVGGRGTKNLMGIETDFKYTSLYNNNS